MPTIRAALLGYLTRNSNRRGRSAEPALISSATVLVSSAPLRIHRPTRLITAPTRNGTRQPYELMSASLRLLASSAARPEARSCPTVVLTYWKLENSPRRPGGAD